ncbi:MAG: hypothetical protein DWH91_14860 [Planctomycetota bacterium]|nr:MAG: hypothetical protein DWH91_14860 [Planctomycetota bacterium]
MTWLKWGQTSSVATRGLGWLLAILMLLGSGGIARAQFEELGSPGEETPPAPADFSINSLLEEKGPSTPFPRKRGEPEVTAFFSPLGDAAGSVVLAITVKLKPGAYTYDLEPVEGFRKNTKIVIDQLTGATATDPAFATDHPPKVGPDINQDNAIRRKFPDEVTFLQRYTVAAGETPSASGLIDMLICDGDSCVPQKIDWMATWDSTAYAGRLPAAWDGSSGGFEVEVEQTEVASSLGYNLLLAFIGGIIMNVMPCVLPVIAIKVLSFVQQAGESRSRIFALNLVYSLGVIAVFVGLATLAAFLKIGMGELFQSDRFNVVMAGVVFVMGLSLLGVFEFQMPGALGSAGGTHREGLPGAFFTGMLATLLATPCIGPFVGPVLAWTIKQDTSVIYMVWTMMGLGMASPYLLLGMFPGLIDWVPRPGMWMLRFKQFCGFVLMATVIFVLNSVSPTMLIPTLVMLLGLSLGLWMIGSLYDHSTPSNTKWKIRIAALIVSLPLIGYGAVQHFGLNQIATSLQKLFGAEELPWEEQEFTEARMVALKKAGTPMLVDFTADWCTTCKGNELWALNTKKTAAFIKEHNIVCLKADFTKESPEIKDLLARFGASGVPLTVIFPPGANSKGIKLDGVFSQSTLLNKLEGAFSSTPESKTAGVDSTSAE